jgi:hypothetical protein
MYIPIYIQQETERPLGLDFIIVTTSQKYAQIPQMVSLFQGRASSSSSNLKLILK